ncbi:MAG: hypothetical protein ACJ741_15655 [Pyrinomonadaceae bacterium]
MRRKSLLNFFPAALCALAALAVSAGGQGLEPAPTADAGQIVAKFISKETEFQRAFSRYAFRRDAVVQSIGMGGQVAGEFHRVSVISFDEQGRQKERVLQMPIPSLAPSPTDLEDLNTIQLFVLEAAKLAQYDFKLVGTEKIDEISTYVFDVAPKVMPDPKKSKDRYFQGRVWIDDEDFLLVKARGHGVPEGNERFPTFDYYREHDGRYWVPSLVTASDRLVMPSGRVVRLRIRVTYSDYEAPPAK